MTSHVVFGAGLIGCYLGAVLQQQKFKVKLVCRPVVRQKLADGVRVTDYQEHAANVNGLKFIDSESLATSQGYAEVVWLTVKCTAVEQACSDMQPLVGPDTLILCCQNGLGSDALVKKTFPDNAVLRVMVPFNVAELSPGHLHRGSEGHLTLEKTVELRARVEAIVDQLSCALLPMATTDHMDALLWAKLQLNLGNSINALADVPVKTMLEQRDYRRVIARMMKELLAVTDAQQIELPKVTALPAHWIPRVLSLPNVLFKLVANRMLAIDPNVRTSMWWDLKAGRKTEIDHLNGAIVAIAAKHNVPCPVNQLVIDKVKAEEQRVMQGKKRAAVSAKSLFEQVSAL